MRALLVYNPTATTTNAAMIDAITGTLAAELKLEVEATKRRDHAGYLAAGAVHEGYEVVLALGGDGTVNEVLQGVAGTPTRLGIIPGGSTNVWARTLGLPNDAKAATAALLERLARRSERTVNLGVANGRYFGFNAGFGYDAEVVRYVEQRHRLKRTVRQASFLYCGVLAYFGGYDRRTRITVTADGDPDEVTVRTAVCCNSDPYTYLGPWAVRLCPAARPDAGLDLIGLKKLSTSKLLRLALRGMTSERAPALRFARSWHDRTGFTLTSPKPLALQVDGDFVGATRQVRLSLAEQAVTIVA